MFQVQFSLIFLLSSCATEARIVKIISDFGSNVEMFSFSKNTSTLYADYTDSMLQVHLAIFHYQNNADKLIRNIKKSLEAVSSMMYGIPTRVIIDVYSLNEKSEFLQKKVFNNFPDENIRFHWYNVKNRLFSGIDVEKWL